MVCGVIPELGKQVILQISQYAHNYKHSAIYIMCVAGGEVWSRLQVRPQYYSSIITVYTSPECRPGVSRSGSWKHVLHEDVAAWRWFPYYWSWGAWVHKISYKGPAMQNFGVFFVVSTNECFTKCWLCFIVITLYECKWAFVCGGRYLMYRMHIIWFQWLES